MSCHVSCNKGEKTNNGERLRSHQDHDEDAVQATATYWDVLGEKSKNTQDTCCRFQVKPTIIKSDSLSVAVYAEHSIQEFDTEMDP